MSIATVLFKVVKSGYKYIKFGGKVSKPVQKSIKPVNSVIERKTPKALTRTTTKYGENGSELVKVETIYNQTDKDVFIRAINYRMPNGQIVNGNFSRRYYYSPLEGKVVNHSGKYGPRNSFISFYRDANGQFHTVEKTHSSINWYGSDRVKSNLYQ